MAAAMSGGGGTPCVGAAAAVDTAVVDGADVPRAVRIAATISGGGGTRVEDDAAANTPPRSPSLVRVRAPAQCAQLHSDAFLRHDAHSVLISFDRQQTTPFDP